LKKILIIDNGQEFGLDEYLIRPLGGSETSILMLSKGLAEIGNSVVLLNNTNKRQKSYNIILDTNKLTRQFILISDIILLNRVNPIDFINYNKPIYYYSHDAYDQEIVRWLFDKQLVSKVEKIFCVSEWQKKTFVDYFGVDPSKLAVINNPIDINLYINYTKRFSNKLIFSSIPFKGLEVLNDLINDLIFRTKNNNLFLHVYSSMSLYNRSQQDNEYSVIYQQLSKNKNIILHDLVSLKQLAIEYASASISIHPNTYHETFGMVLAQSQAAGCLPVSTNIGSVNEVIQNKNNITSYPNIYNQDCYNEFIEKIIRILNTSEDDLYVERLTAQNFVKRFNYINIATEFLKYIK